MSAAVTVFEGEIAAWANNIGGPIGNQLVASTEAVVLPEAREALSVPAVRENSYRAFSANVLSHYSWQLNPPEGPPRMRTGDLHNSLEAVGPLIDEKGIVAYGVAWVSHRGFPYPIHLRQRGYKFLPLGDPRYIYDEMSVAS